MQIHRITKIIAAPLADAVAIAVERVLREFEQRINKPPPGREDDARIRSNLASAQTQLAEHRARLQAAHAVVAQASAICDTALARGAVVPAVARTQLLKLQQLVDEFDRGTS